VGRDGEETNRDEGEERVVGSESDERVAGCGVGSVGDGSSVAVVGVLELAGGGDVVLDGCSVGGLEGPRRGLSGEYRRERDLPCESRSSSCSRQAQELIHLCFGLLQRLRATGEARNSTEIFATWDVVQQRSLTTPPSPLLWNAWLEALLQIGEYDRFVEEVVNKSPEPATDELLRWTLDKLHGSSSPPTPLPTTLASLSLDPTPIPRAAEILPPASVQVLETSRLLELKGTMREAFGERWDRVEEERKLESLKNDSQVANSVRLSRCSLPHARFLRTGSDYFPFSAGLSSSHGYLPSNRGRRREQRSVGRPLKKPTRLYPYSALSFLHPLCRQTKTFISLLFTAHQTS